MNKLLRPEKHNLKEWYPQLKEDAECTVYGFDHLKKKKYTISRMVRNAFPIEEIEKELAKCIPICSNCHRIEHLTLYKTGESAFGLDYK